MEVSARPLRCLVTGATGYVGSRLVPELLAAGYSVRCMSRSLARLRDRPWADQVEIVAADAGDAGTLGPALAGIDVAFYLVHSLGGGKEFEAADRNAAHTFAAAARAAGVRRIVYLGGLRPATDDEDELSTHLRSRSEVGEILLRSGVPTVVLRAAVIVGAGSASFEMLRYLTERLPVMVTPRWVATRVQPIAIPDVLRYLVGCAGLPGEVNRAFDIGGPEVLTYVEMMRRYAAVAGLHRRVIVVLPLLTPALSSLWIGLVTPVPAALARPLVDSLYHEVVCRDRDITGHVPDAPAGPIGFEHGVRLALRRIQEIEVDTTDPDQAAPGPDRSAASEPLPTDPGWAGGSLYRDVRARRISASPEVLWWVLAGIPGGFEQPPPRPRGLVMAVGVALGPWRIEEIAPDRLLRLRATGPFPGTAWLELGMRPGKTGVDYTQRALFHPHGLLGHLWWWAMRPCTRTLLAGLERSVTRSARELQQAISARAPSRSRHQLGVRPGVFRGSGRFSGWMT